MKNKKEYEKCITYQTEPKHVVIMNARNAATAFYPFRRWKNPMPGLRGGGGL